MPLALYLQCLPCFASGFSRHCWVSAFTNKINRSVQENRGCSPKPGSGQRLLSNPAVETGALRDISAARAAQRGIRINETGYERDDEDEDDQSAMMDRLRLVTRPFLL